MTAAINALVEAVPLRLALPAARTTTLTGTGLDRLGYEGMAIAVLHSAKGSGNADNTLDVKVQDSADNSSFADISGATFSQVLGTGGADVLAAIPIDLKIARRYLRVIGTIAGTTPSFVFGVDLIAMKRYRP